VERRELGQGPGQLQERHGLKKVAREAETLEINIELAAIPGTSFKVSRVAIGTWAISRSLGIVTIG
jgi:hypothetical protein